MRRPLTLRQIDIFRATIETGTVSRAAEMLNISQPAASKLLSNLEQDANLTLFQRVKGRLIPTAVAMQLYEEVEKVFVGIGQIEQVIDAMQRRAQERLTIGVIPALSQFMAQAVVRFARRHPKVVVSIEERGTQFVAEWILNRRVDIGMMSEKIDVPHVRTQTLIRRELVCAIPKGHPLAARAEVMIEDLRDEPIIGYTTRSQTERAMMALFAGAGIEPNVVIEATSMPLICQFVAGGVGLGVVHPLGVGAIRDELVLRPLKPTSRVGYQLCWSADNRNMRLIEAFSEDVAALARTF